MPHQVDQDEAMQLIAGKLIDIARDEYKFYSLEIKNRQTKIQNIYFWIAVVLFTAYSAAFKGLIIGDTFIHLQLLPRFPAWLHETIVIIGYLPIVYVIFTGVCAMKGKGPGHRNIFDSHSPLAMYETFLASPDITQSDMIRLILRDSCRNTAYNADACVDVGKHLRVTSWALMISIAIGILAFLI